MVHKEHLKCILTAESKLNSDAISYFIILGRSQLGQTFKDLKRLWFEGSNPEYKSAAK